MAKPQLPKRRGLPSQFIDKLWDFVRNAQTIVRDGERFIITNRQEFIKEANKLNFFKHKDINSFFRQCCYYGIKIADNSFYHENFTWKGDKISLIKREAKTKKRKEQQDKRARRRSKNTDPSPVLINGVIDYTSIFDYDKILSEIDGVNIPEIDGVNIPDFFGAPDFDIPDFDENLLN